MPADILKCKYLIIGLGKSGQAAAKTILAAGGQAYLYDDRDVNDWPILDPQQKPFTPDMDMNDFSAVIASPGISQDHFLLSRARENNLEVICDIELFYRAYHDHNEAKFIAITGTNGKSTVTALLQFMLSALGQSAMACGNIGTAIFDCAPPNGKIYYCIEISSFQADLCFEFAPDIAIFLNLTEDHLDRHQNMEGYFSAKMKLFQHIPKKGKAIILGRDKYHQAARDISENYYSPMEDTDISAYLGGNPSLQGQHNHQNALYVFATLVSLGFDTDVFLPLFNDFCGLAHRLEYVTKIDHITYINDSKATNAEASLQALKAYENIYWLVGGVTKSQDIGPLIPHLSSVKHIFIYGQDQDIIAKRLMGKDGYFSVFETLGQALTAAQFKARQDLNLVVILLSPAAASQDQFKNFEARGDYFKNQVLLSK